MGKGTGGKASSKAIRERRQVLPRESKGLFRSLAENSIDVTVIVNSDGSIRYASPPMERFTGRKPKDQIGRSVFQFVHPEDKQSAIDAFAQVMQNPGFTVCKEVRIQHADGSWRHMEGVGKNLLDDPDVRGIVVTYHELTKLREREEALRQNEERFRNVLENSLDMIYRLSLETGTYNYVSPSSRQVIGYRPEDLIALGVEQARALAHPDDIQRLDENVIQLLTQAPEQGMPQGIEYRFKHKELGYRWVSDTRSLVYDERNVPVAVVGNLRDITERKRAEEALRASAQQWQATFDAVSDAVSLMDTEGRIMQCNEAMSNLLGKPSSEIIGSTCWELMHGASEPIEGCPVVRMRETRRRESLVLPKADRWFEVSVDPLLDGSGALMGAVHIISDITERKQAEEAIREAERRYRAIFENRLIMVFVNNEKGLFLDANDAALARLGYTRKDIRKLSFQVIVHPEDLTGIIEGMYDVMDKGYMESPVELRVIGASGEVVWVEIFGVPLHRSAEHYVGLGIALDITERKQAEEELAKHRHHLEELVEERTAELEQQITERKQAEEEIRKFKTISDRAGYGLAMSDIEGNLIYVNESFAKMHGYAADELIGKNLSIFHNKEQMENVNRLNEELKRQGSYIAEEVWHTRKDNTVFPALMNGTLVMGAQGGPLFMAATTIDITERKRADEALRQQEEYFRTLIEHSYDAISIINADGTIRYHSPSYERLLGYYPEEEIGRRAPGYVHSDDIPKASRAFAQLLREPGSIVHDEVRVWHKDGSLRTLEVVGQNLLDNPAVVGIVTNFHDITERKEMEQAIREEEERFRALIENAQDGIVILNGDGIIHYESPSMACMLGYNLEDHIGKNLFDVIHPDDVLTAADLFTQVLRTSGERINTEVRIQHQDGSWHTVHTIVHNLLDDPAVAGVVVNMRDVTESRRAEEELKQSHQQLRQLTTHLEKIREEERTVIAREIHDELGQVLTALKMDLSWMISRLKQKPLLEKAKAMLELINYSIQTVKKISMNLRPGILDDLGIVAATEWQLGELQNRTGIEYKLNTSPEHISLCRERTTAIFRILQEILTNITRHANATRVEVSLTQEPDKLLLKVNDNGIGISKAEMSASQSFGLMGIRERAHSFGGRVVIEGIKNKGTTVTVIIPS